MADLLMERSVQEHVEELAKIVHNLGEGDMMNKQRDVIQRLGTIRTAKKKLLAHLKILMEKETHDKDGTPELIHKIVQSYDGLKKQEDEFTSALRKIIFNYFRALDDVLPKLSLLKEKIGESDEEEESTTLSKVDDLLSKLDSTKKMIIEVNDMLKESEDASNLLDEQLKARLEIHFELIKKSKLLQQLQKKGETSHNQQSNQEATSSHRNVVSNSNPNSERKQRQLDRLRKEAARRGILNKNASAEGIQSADQEKSSESELQVAEDNERIPPIPKLPELGTSINNNKDDIRAKISERFASIETRKHRMRLIQSKLSNLQRQKMDNTYEEALKRFKNLSEMRKKLEELQSFGADASDDDDTPKNSFEATNATALKEPNSDNNSVEVQQEIEDNRSSVSTNELLNEVRRAFNSAFNKDMAGMSIDSQTTGNMPGSSSFESAFSSLGDRLKVIENVLHNHTDQLIWIGNQVDQQQKEDDSQNTKLEGEENCFTAKNMVLRIMQKIEHLFDDKVEKIDGDFASRLTDTIIDESKSLCPQECHEKIGQNFPSIIEGIAAPYNLKEVGEIKGQLIKELSEALESEFTFIFLIQNANALTTDA